MLKEKYLLRLHWFIRLCMIFFSLLFFYLLITFVFPKILPTASISNTSKYGLIFRNENWSGEIKVIGDIWALPGTVVTVKPGTKILVAGNGDKSNLHFLPWEWKSGLNTDKERFGVKNGELFKDEGQKISIHFGKLYAIGSKEQSIIIKSDLPYQPSPYDFNTISLSSGILSDVEISNYRRLEPGDEVTIRNSNFHDVAECAVCIDYTSPTVINNVFENALREYIWTYGGSPRISDNWFASSKGKGIVVDPQIEGSPLIFHNNFEMPGATTIEFLSGSENAGGVISFNDFAGFSEIKIPCDSKVKIIQNQIRGVIRLAHSGNCIGNLNLGSNYWFSLDKQAILREKIVDKEASFKVLMPSVLFNPPALVGRRSI